MSRAGKSKVGQQSPRTGPQLKEDEECPLIKTYSDWRWRPTSRTVTWDEFRRKWVGRTRGDDDE